MAHPLLSNSAGEQHLLLGNEAIVRGALEAGVRFVSCYPGTPSSEVPDTFYRLSSEGDFYFEYSTNEKVALEVGGGAALGGAATVVTMKHVGVNVAADPLMTLAYIGAPGGLVLLSADDPGCHSSQNEQDNRYYARLAGMPVLEPSTAQEAKDMMRDALRLSRETGQPFMLRTTTRVNHLRGSVEFGPLPGKAPLAGIDKSPMRYVPIPAVARTRHGVLLKFLEQARELAEASPWNTQSGEGDVGVIATGISRAYLADALAEAGLEGKVKVLDLGFSYPLPLKKIENFLRAVKKAVVLEELEPLLETDLRALCQRLSIDTEIIGKGGTLSREGEYTVQGVARVLADAAGAEYAEPATAPAAEGLPMRPPNLCAGCSHRAAYYATRQVFGDDAFYSTDIGCYTLGILPPLKAADFLLCMGSSISAGSGFARASGKPVVGFIGDSTFFHSGITGLVNAVFNKHDVVLMVLDNRTTAMTGHQPHPGVDVDLMHGEHAQLDIESVVRGCGVTQLWKVKPYNVKSTTKALEEAKAASGVRVIIAEEPCVLFARRALKKTAAQTAYVAEQGEDAARVFASLACPAFYKDGEEFHVDENSCSGCMVCMQLSKSFKARKRSA